ncbi:MAG: leucyl aminopeptidase family protein, partial [Pseudomonadota bacterium]
MYRTTLDSWSTSHASTRPLIVVSPADAEARIGELMPEARRWLEATNFKAKAGAITLLPDGGGDIAAALIVTSDKPELWDIAKARMSLPTGSWAIEDKAGLIDGGEAALAWALDAYVFERYKRREEFNSPVLVVGAGDAVDRARYLAEAAYLGRDLVNTPALDLGPAELADAVEELAGAHGAEYRQIVGADLLDQNFPAIHVVGMASPREPRLIDLRWGDVSAPKVTLVGKGVCFDTGGLNLKPGRSMAMMKKDMGGSAAMIALAHAVMASGLNVRLRLLVPAVENSVGGASFRPGDVIQTRAGKTVEIGNTDAEGRLVLADALALAIEEEPELLIDAATLTGAARVALGPDLPVLFSNDDHLSHDLLSIGGEIHDPLGFLPLHAPYKRYIKSPIADLNNSGAKPFAGSITAALFLKDFVGGTKSWAHLDVFGYNDETRPGRPNGGEAMALRPLFTLLERRYG